jgi:hypothetical protein
VSIPLIVPDRMENGLFIDLFLLFCVLMIIQAGLHPDKLKPFLGLVLLAGAGPCSPPLIIFLKGRIVATRLP